MRVHLIRAVALTAALQLAPAWAAPLPYPATFKIKDIKTPEATIHVRVGGSGPAVVLLIDESTRAHYAKLYAAWRHPGRRDLRGRQINRRAPPSSIRC